MAELDEMVNDWGCDLVQWSGRGQVTENQFDHLAIRKAVPGFQLMKLEISGTAANMTAINFATNCDIGKCLFAAGSYSGGWGELELMSTSSFSVNRCLSLPKSPEGITNTRCLIQTVPLPYFITCEQFGDDIAKQIENSCLQILHKRLLFGLLIGEPVKAVILELILGGCGGELSNRFLKQFGSLCSHHGVSIIVDEIMTGGRVGPTMTITQATPLEFLKAVKYITIGKIINCGVVLEQCPKNPRGDEGTGRGRGSSTRMDPGEAYHRWVKVMKRLNEGVVPVRRREVLQLLKVSRIPESHWGVGCLVFTNRARPSVTRGLKNRLLPMLEHSKLRKGV